MQIKQEMRSYFDQYLMVSILMPKNWTIEWLGRDKFRLFSPSDPIHQDYKSTISYALGKPQDYSRQWFENLIQQSGDEMQQDYNEYALNQDEYFELDSYLAYRRYFSWKDEESNYTFSQLQVFVLCSQSSLYLINAATLKELEGTYNEIFDDIIQSTRILVPERT